MIVFPLIYLSTFNIVALVVGPLVLILLAVIEFAYAQSRAAKRQQATFSPSATLDNEAEPVASASQVLSLEVDDPVHSEDIQVNPSEHESIWSKPKGFSFGVVWKHGRFWVTLVLSIGTQVASVVGFVKLNPFVSVDA